MRATFDQRTGTFSYPETETDREETAAYVEDQIQDPCTCPVVDGPHHHGPYAYPVIEGGTFFYCGG